MVKLCAEQYWVEAAQGRKADAVKRHFRLSCLAQSVLQRAPTVASASEQVAFAKGETPFGQRCRTLTRVKKANRSRHGQMSPFHVVNAM
jgi:hypothetical protein